MFMPSKKRLGEKMIGKIYIYRNFKLKLGVKSSRAVYNLYFLNGNAMIMFIFCLTGNLKLGLGSNDKNFNPLQLSNPHGSK
jgi:hypothetical protein